MAASTRARTLGLRRFAQGQSPAANVLRMLAGNAFAQALTLAAYPILTRLYTPGQIGVLSALTAAVLILTPMASLRIESALPMSRTTREAGSLLAASALALVSTTVLLAIVLALLPSNWPGEMAAAAPYRWFLPLALAAFGGYMIMVNEATRRNRFTDIARTRVMQAVGGPLGQIGFHALGFGTFGLLLGYVIGQSAGTFGLVWRLLRGRDSPLRPMRRVRWRAVRAAVSRHRDLALFSSWTGVISAASTYLMTIAFAFIYGPAISGFIFLGERVVMRPLDLIASSIQPVYTRELARLHQAQDRLQMCALFVRVVSKQALLALAWLVPVAVAAPWVIPWAFGEQWAPSASYLQVLAIGYFLTSVLHPVLNTLLVMREQKLLAAMDVGRSVVVFAAVAAVAVLRLPPLMGLLMCSLAQAASQVVVLWLTWRRLQVPNASAQRGTAR
jgi:O-antigen/teichoic acid export membrane protein